jgi:hypothetical protein
MAIAKYRFDVFTGTLTLSKAFEKNASIIGSAEQKVLSELMAKYGDALVINRYKPHKHTKGVRFAQMENYIIHTRDGAAMLKQFESVKELSHSQDKPYQYVKDWFLAHYPYYTENPEFDAEGFVVVKAAPAAKNHTENDGSTAENTVSKLAEGTEKTHDISSSNTQENAYTQDEEDAA